MISPMTICYALKTTHDFARSEYVLERTDYNRKKLEELSLAVEEIDAGKFEIEGYERVQWMKFDTDDPKTLPKQYPVMILYCGGIEICSHFYKGEFRTGVGDSYAPEKITHWRPIPKPPIETEA